MGSFGEALAQNLADRWAAVAAPALAFWAAGAGAYVLAHPDAPADFRNWLNGLGGALQFVLAATALGLVLVSAAAVEWLVRPATHALEGYWPLLARVQWLLNRRRTTELDQAQKRWDELMTKLDARTATWSEQQELAGLDTALRRVPADESERMPTRLGDILRAGELWPQLKYGLEPAACFPRLWLVLPESARTELTAARQRLDRAVGVWIWALLLVVWAPWAPWAPAVAAALAYGIYRTWILTAAPAYADLLESAFDVHRSGLYEAVGLPRPDSFEQERDVGIQLTQYLWRGVQPSVHAPTYEKLAQ